MSDTGRQMAAYAEFLTTYRGVREQHSQAHLECISSDHCHIHHVDEPDNGDTYRQCLECGHVFVTELDLQAADVAIRTKIWQATLRAADGPVDHSGVPEAVPGKDIDVCPLCTHSF